MFSLQRLPLVVYYSDGNIGVLRISIFTGQKQGSLRGSDRVVHVGRGGEFVMNIYVCLARG